MPDFPERFTDAYEAGKSLAHKALTALRSGVEDTREVFELDEDFSILMQAQETIARFKGQLKDFGPTDLFSSGRLRELESVLYNINHHVEDSNTSLTHILGTSLRFSPAFMQAPISQAQTGLDQLNGTSVSIVEWLGRNKTSGPHADLRLDVLNLRTNLGILYQNLDALVDPTLVEPTNNVLLNQYLQIDEVREHVQQTAEELRAFIHRLDQIKSALDRLRSK